MGPTGSVMIVDDEPIVGRRLKPTLERLGFEVEFYDDPRAALERLDVREFDVVVTDLRMPGVDGLRLVERARAGGRRTRVLVITAFATPETARDAIARGASECIAKPFRLADLAAAIERAVARARAET